MKHCAKIVSSIICVIALAFVSVESVYSGIEFNDANELSVENYNVRALYNRLVDEFNPFVILIEDEFGEYQEYVVLESVGRGLGGIRAIMPLDMYFSIEAYWNCCNQITPNTRFSYMCVFTWTSNNPAICLEHFRIRREYCRNCHTVARDSIALRGLPGCLRTQ